jgi:lipopolysaccharide transport system ATP-binding protein
VYLQQGQLKDYGSTGPVVDHYLRDIHESLNRDLRSPRPARQPSVPAGEAPEELHDRFDRFASQFPCEPQGTGEARIRLAEVLDEAGEPADWIEFGARTTIRIWVQCLQPCSVSVNYKIRDRNLVAVAGADFLIAGHDLLAMKPGELYLVEYVTRLTLKDGDYTLRFSLTQPIDKHQRAVFVDIVEIALPFKVLPSPLGKIYTSVYLPNTVVTTKLSRIGSPPCSPTRELCRGAA